MKPKILAFVAVLSLISGCTASVETDTTDLDNHLSIYETAKDRNDFQTAATALNYALQLDSGNLALTDSLSRMYFKLRNMDACVELAEQVIIERPSNELNEILGFGYQSQGKLDQAVEVFDALHQTTGDDKFKWQVAIIHYNNQNVLACDSTVDLLLESGDSATIIETQGANGGVELVPLHAACHNLKGIMNAEIKQNLSGAVRDFKRALKLAPTYSIPQYYLNQIQEYQRMQYMR